MYKKRALSKLLTNLQNHAIFPTLTIFIHFSFHLVLQTVCQIRPCHMETAISKIREVGEYTVPSFELKADRKDNEISGSDLRNKAPRIHNLYLLPVHCFYWIFIVLSKMDLSVRNQWTLPIPPSCCNNCLNSAMVRGAEPPSRNRAEAAATVCDRQPRSSRNHSRSLAICLQKDENDWKRLKIEKRFKKNIEKKAEQTNMH